MSAVSSSFLSIQSPLHPPRLLSSSPGFSLKPKDNILCINPRSTTSKARLTVQASGQRDSPSNAGFFVGGFVLGGIVVGTLGCAFAPQISKALAAADRKDLMRKLPKFIYDEEKALERTRKVLAEKIDQLNAAIDEVSAQLHPDDAPKGAQVMTSTDEVQASTST